VQIGVLKNPAPAADGRVLLTPRDAAALARAGGRILVERGAGQRAGFSDIDYEQAGCQVAYRREEVLRRSRVALSVSRPFPEDAAMLQPGALIMGLFHPGVGGAPFLAAAEAAGAAVVALERATVAGRQPFRERMARVAGVVTAQLAARLLETDSSRGVLLGGVAGVPPAEVVIVGAGALGGAAARTFSGLGAQVAVFDARIDPLEALARERLPGVITALSGPDRLERAAGWADVLIGAARADEGPPPRLLTPAWGRPGAVWIDAAVDEGGCVEGSRPVHDVSGAYLDHGVLCCPIPTLPARVARTASHVLSSLLAPALLAALAAQTPLIEAASWLASGRPAAT